MTESNAATVLARHHVQVTGKVSADRTAVFVHGFGTDQRAWADVAAAFLPHFRVVLLDNAGSGGADDKSFAQHYYLKLHGYAQDLMDVCAALDVRHAVFIGHSVGAIVCALTALARPAVCERLVMIGASPRYLDAEDYRGGFTNADLDALYRAISEDLPNWATNFAATMMENAHNPALSVRFADAIRAIPAQRVLTVLCSIFQSDHRDDVAKLQLPTLLIQSRNDRAVPLDVAEFLHAQIRHSTLKVIDTHGHLPHVSAPEVVVDALRDFVGL